MQLRALWQLHAVVGLLLFATLSPKAAGSIPNQWDWDQHHEALTHPYSREAALHGAKLPYHKDRQECYYKEDRKHNTVITVLLQHKPGVVRVISSGSLQRVLEHTSADVIFFHTGWSQQDIETYVKPNASFPFEAKCIANIDWSTGHHAEAWEALETGLHGPGYRSMCRWFSRRLFNAIHSMGYEWVIRLDEDSEVLSSIPYNITDQMISHKAQYGFRGFAPDVAPVVYSLSEAARYWIVSQRLNPADLWITDFFGGNNTLDRMSSANYDNCIIYNNFFVANVTWWMEPQVQGWLRHLEMLRGFHKFRWGDAPVHLFTTAMHLKREQMLQFDFAYKHQIRNYPAGNYGPYMHDGLPKLNLTKTLP